MNAFQWFFIVFCLAQIGLALLHFRRSGQLGALGFALVWVVAIALLLNPDISSRLAAVLGIGRGVDLVVYALSFLFLWGHYQHYARYKRVENHVTALVRELAIVQASEPNASRDVNLQSA